MSDEAPIQPYVTELEQGWSALALLERPQREDEIMATLGQTMEIAIHNAVLNAAHGLAQRDVPGASRFLDAYSGLVREFWLACDATPGFQLGVLDQRRAKNLRPAALYMVASFLTRLTHLPDSDQRGVIGGGPDRNPPRAAFLDLVRTVHADSKDINEVILTDPYLFVDEGDDKETGGYEGTLAYLKAVGLTPECRFVLKVTPAPRRATATAVTTFERFIRTAFPNVTVGRFPARCTFHDRLYMTRDSSGQLRGVFGPSMNGLASSSIVIMGPIGAKDLTMLSRWL